jgi:hypothetical protein
VAGERWVVLGLAAVGCTRDTDTHGKDAQDSRPQESSVLDTTLVDTGTTPAWIPTGPDILYYSDGATIWRLRIPTGEQTLVWDGVYPDRMELDPSGFLLAFEGALDLEVVRADGSGRVLTTPALGSLMAFADPTWLVTVSGLFHPDSEVALLYVDGPYMGLATPLWGSLTSSGTVATPARAEVMHEDRLVFRVDGILVSQELQLGGAASEDPIDLACAPFFTPDGTVVCIDGDQLYSATTRLKDAQSLTLSTPLDDVRGGAPGTVLGSVSPSPEITPSGELLCDPEVFQSDCVVSLDVSTGQLTRLDRLSGVGLRLDTARISPDGNTLIAVVGDTAIWRFDPRGSATEEILHVEKGRLGRLAW